MDELNRKLEEILNDPESMNKVRLMAESLLGEENETKENDSNMPNSDELGRMMSIIGAMKSKSDDNRANLLLALRPHLSQKRREKVDSAVKLLKLIEALPLLKEAGILDFG